MNLLCRLATRLLILLGIATALLHPGALSAAPASLPSLQVSLQGLNRVEEALVSCSLSIKAAENESDLSDDRLESLQQIAIPEITRTLETLGYYESKIQEYVYSSSNGYHIVYRIEKGAPILIQSVTLQVLGEGQRNPVILKRIQENPLKPGAQLKHGVYENYKQELLSTALQEGYLEVQFIQNDIRIHRAQHQADILWVLNTGPQYKIGKLLFKDPPYPPEYLKRYLKEVEATPYTTCKLLECQKILTETELFKQVRLDPLFEETKDHCVPLQFRLYPRPKNKYLGGLGYGTDMGPRGMISWERRRLHHPGHWIHTEFKIAQRIKQINLQYILPGQNPIRDRYVFGIQGVEEILWDGKYSRRAEFGFTQLKRFDQWERGLSLKYLSEVFRELPTDPKRSSHFLMPGLGLVWRTHRNPENNPGTPFLKAGLTTRTGLGTLFSSTNFVQGELRMKGIYPLTHKTRFLLRGDIGITGAQNFDDVPYSLRYFTGGDQTVRGYGYKSLGPIEKDRNGTDIVVGGRYLIVGSLELEQAIYKKFSLAAFVDAGQAMNRWDTPLACGLGVGIRYATPLGPLRLDFARPIYQPIHRIRIHVSFGLDL